MQMQPLKSYENKETDSPRYSALLRLTHGSPKKKNPIGITSFSHELTDAGIASHPFLQLHNAKSSGVCLFSSYVHI